MRLLRDWRTWVILGSAAGIGAVLWWLGDDEEPAPRKVPESVVEVGEVILASVEAAPIGVDTKATTEENPFGQSDRFQKDPVTGAYARYDYGGAYIGCEDPIGTPTSDEKCWDTDLFLDPLELATDPRS